MKIPHIEHAFEHIKTRCAQRLSELYPVHLPADISERYEKELSYLENSEYIDDFEIFRRLSAEALKCSVPLHTRGLSMGSFLYYLLGNYCFNPLPAHYYCADCGHYETVQTHLFGIDLPEKTCPGCGRTLIADGYNLPLESVWGINGRKIISFEYNISTEFFPFARRVLAGLYPDNEIVPWGMFHFDEDEAPYSQNRVIGVYQAGYAVLPTGSSIADYPELTSYLENGDPCLTGGSWNLSDHSIKPVRLLPSDYVEALLKLQRATGVYTTEITTEKLRAITWSDIYQSAILPRMSGNLFENYKPQTFRDMAALDASCHNTFSWNDPHQDDMHIFCRMMEKEPFLTYPCCTREDFFDYLLDAGTERSLAFQISEKIRKGRRDLVAASPMPDGLREVAEYYLYVFPRAHCVEYLLMYARIAYYATLDRKTFGKLMFKKKM